MKKILIVVAKNIVPYQLNFGRSYTKAAEQAYPQECTGPFGAAEKLHGEDGIFIALSTQQNPMLLSGYLNKKSPEMSENFIKDFPPACSLLTTEEVANKLVSIVSSKWAVVTVFSIDEKKVLDYKQVS